MTVQAYAVAAVVAVAGTGLALPATSGAATPAAAKPGAAGSVTPAVAPVPAKAGADTVLYGPPPGWVKVVPLPAAPAAEPGAPYALRLSDNQAWFGPDGDQVYNETAFDILSEAGLDAGSLTQEWDPATETVTINRLNVVREGQVIDVLKSDKFEILRRETNLESAMLDGRLTAVLQIKGLRVGDTLDFVSTRLYRDPVAGGRAEWRSTVDHTGLAGRVRYRLLWPKDRPMRWTKGVGLSAPTVTEGPTGGELALDLANYKAPVAPEGAPMRYGDVGALTVSGFKDWSEVSALMAPLYAKAATLEVNSPLKAEVAKIKAASPDPVVRAGLALKLVESQVRYVFVGLDGNGRKPAAADDTWRHRFGDCKGKTALLLALLKELDIAAEPALANSSGYGDAVEARLPGMDMFDHVLARAVIDGKVYWLDGTRSGDESLANLETPDFRWVLPLRASGGALEKLERPPAVRPYGEIVMRVDATAGAEVPAKIEVEAVFRGDAAVEANRGMIGKPREETRRAALRAWSSDISWAEFKDIDWTYDAAGALFVVTVKGTGKIDWSTSDGVRRWELENTQFSLRQFDRDSAQDLTAPYAVNYPTYGRWVTAVQLPDQGEGFKIQGLTVNQIVGGVALRRSTEVHDGRLVMMRSARAMVPEISAADAKIATALAKHDDYGIIAIKLQPKTDKATKGGGKDKSGDGTDPGLMARGYEAWTAGRVDDAQKLFEKARDADPSKTRPWEALVNIQLSRKVYDRALEISDQAARKDSAHPEVWKSNRAGVLVQADRADEAVAELTTALAASPKSTPLLVALAKAHRAQGHADLAGQDLDRALAAAPDDTDLLGRRAEHAVFVKDYAGAARLYEAIIAKEPDEAWGFQALANVHAVWGNTDEALRQVDEALRIDPFDPSALSQRAGINLERKRYDLALVDTDRALALRPDIPSLWNERCWVRAVWGQELDKALTDCDAALKAMPKMAAALDSRGLVNLRQGRFEAAVRDYDAALVLSPKQAASLYGRGLVKLKLGDKTAAQADLTAAVAADAGIGKRFEGYGLKAE